MSMTCLTIKVTVIQTDIDTGRRAGCKDCPIAHAICRILPSSDVSVHATCVAIDKTTVRLPAVAREFIKNFDETGKGSPFEFELSSAPRCRHCEEEIGPIRDTWGFTSWQGRSYGMYHVKASENSDGKYVMTCADGQNEASL